MYDLARNTLTKLTFHGIVNVMGAWTPDGKRIAFASNTDGPFNLFWQLADFSGGLERLTRSENSGRLRVRGPRTGNCWRSLNVNPTTGYDIWVLGTSDGKAQPFLRTPANESAPQFSARRSLARL